MKSALRFRLIPLLFVFSIAIGGIFDISCTPQVRAEPLLGKDLVNGTPEQWKQAVLDWTKNRYVETPIQVLLVRRATQSDLEKFGPSYAKNAETNPFALVVLKGNFQDGAKKMSGSNFLLYMLDLKAGLPAVIGGSNGEDLRKALNMPNLGKEIPPLSPKATEPPNRVMGLW
jgi:hypothetical protein